MSSAVVRAVASSDARHAESAAAAAGEDALSILMAGRFAARNHRGVEPRDLIRALRRGAGLSQRELGLRAGIRQERVSRIEAGVVAPRWPEIRALLEAARCEPFLLALGRGYEVRPPDADWDE